MQANILLFEVKAESNWNVFCTDLKVYRQTWHVLEGFGESENAALCELCWSSWYKRKRLLVHGANFKWGCTAALPVLKSNVKTKQTSTIPDSENPQNIPNYQTRMISR